MELSDKSFSKYVHLSNNFGIIPFFGTVNDVMTFRMHKFQTFLAPGSTPETSFKYIWMSKQEKYHNIL